MRLCARRCCQARDQCRIKDAEEQDDRRRAELWQHKYTTPSEHQAVVTVRQHSQGGWLAQREPRDHIQRTLSGYNWLITCTSLVLYSQRYRNVLRLWSGVARACPANIFMA